MQPPGGLQPPGYKGGPGRNDDDDVEAHGMQPPGGLQPPGYKGGPGRNDDDDDVEAHKLQ
jgi:hypothetical protein